MILLLKRLQDRPHSAVETKSSSLNTEEYKSMLNELENSRTENKRLKERIQEYEHVLQEENDHFRQLQEENKQAEFVMHKRWAKFCKQTIDLCKRYHLFSEKKVNSKEEKVMIDDYFRQLDDYEQFLNVSLEDLKDLNEQQNQDETINVTNNDGFPPVNSTPLDFKKIKKAFIEEDDENILCSLLQAIRFRITRMPNAITRREIVIQMVSNDILNNKLAHVLIEKKGPRVRESAVRFINALAYEYMGRSYLIEHEKLINHLVYILKSEPEDNVIRRACLGTLQKLSLRRRPQEILIENDLIRWTVNMLSTKKESITEYTCEYGTALLMNLSLRTLGKQKCEEIKTSILELLKELITHPNFQVGKC